MLIAYGLLSPRATTLSYPNQSSYAAPAAYTSGSSAPFAVPAGTVPCSNDMQMTYPYGNAVLGNALVANPVTAQPVRTVAVVDRTPVEVRMESWLAADTIRRMGFGHVIAGRRHTLIVERGVSLVAFDEGGLAIRTLYAAGIFAPQPRYLVTFARAIVEP